MKKTYYSSIFFVILCINLCSILILSIFNYYVFHSMSDRAYLESFLSYHKRVTELAFHNIDNEIIQSVLEISQLHFSSIKENEPVLLPQQEDISSASGKIYSLSTEMKKIQKTYPFIENIDIYYEATTTVVTGFDKVHFPANNELLIKYIPWYEDYKTGSLTDGFGYNERGVYLKNNPVITYIKSILMPKWKGKKIILAISIDPQSFSQYIDQQEGELIILNRENKVLYDSSGLENSLEKKKEQTEVFQSCSEVTGLNYIYRVDASKFYKEYNITSRMFLINFLISIVFNIIILLLISYYNYITYRKRVLTLSEKVGIPIESSSRSFDGSLNVLMEEIKELSATVESSKGMMFQNTVRSLILNRKMDNVAEEISEYLNKEHVCAYIIYLGEKEMENLSVENLQSEYPPNQLEYEVLYTTVDKDSLAALLVFDESNEESVHRDFIQQINHHWKDCSIVYGPICKIKENGIKMSYKAAKEAEQYRYIITDKIHLSFSEINIENRKESGSHLKLFEAMKKDINNEDLLLLKTHLEMLVTSFKSGSYSIQYCISTLGDFVTFLYQIMQQHQLDMWIVFGYDIREYYKKIPNIEVFHNWCDSLCEMILKNIYQKKQAVDVDIRTQMIRMIDENLENNISLDFMAEQLQMRADVASRTFRQMMGMGYAEYIRNRKLKRGIELLEEGCSVKEIAEKLGYSTSQYFIKVFKESYGVTPLQYKKSLKNEIEKEEGDKLIQ